MTPPAQHPTPPAAQPLTRWRLSRFRPRLIDDSRDLSRTRLGTDLAAGVTVGIVALPLAMAFAIASGLKPEQGLIAAVVGGFVISALGGSSVQIGGPAGAFIVVVSAIVAEHGVPGLWTATLLSGVLMVFMGLLGLGRWVRRIPASVVAGFTNGIAVLIILSQVKDLLGLQGVAWPADFIHQLQTLAAHAGQWSGPSVILGCITFVGMLVWQGLWQDRHLLPQALVAGRAARTVSRIPGAIVALVSTAAATAWWDWPVQTLGTRFGSIPSFLPTPIWPLLPAVQWPSLLGPAATLALLGAIESLLCARVADALIPQVQAHDPNQELMAQGLANAAVPFFAGMPVTGTIARTVTNVRSGGRTPWAGIAHAVTVLAIMVVAAPWCLLVPLPALAGVLLFVAWNMGEWRDFVRVWAHHPWDRVMMLLTFTLTVVVDLGAALLLGIGLAVLRAWAARRPGGPGPD